MNKFTTKSIKFFSIVSFLLITLIVEIVYLYSTDVMSNSEREKKMRFVSLVGLPDLAISTEATYVRHRSLSNLFSIYKDDGALREYFPSTFAISHSQIINKKVEE